MKIIFICIIMSVFFYRNIYPQSIKNFDKLFIDISDLGNIIPIDGSQDVENNKFKKIGNEYQKLFDKFYIDVSYLHAMYKFNISKKLRGYIIKDDLERETCSNYIWLFILDLEKSNFIGFEELSRGCGDEGWSSISHSLLMNLNYDGIKDILLITSEFDPSSGPNFYIEARISEKNDYKSLKIR